MLFVLLHNEMFSNQRPFLALHCSHSLINQLGGWITELIMEIKLQKQTSHPISLCITGPLLNLLKPLPLKWYCNITLLSFSPFAFPSFSSSWWLFSVHLKLGVSSFRFTSSSKLKWSLSKHSRLSFPFQSGVARDARRIHAENIAV